MSSTDEGVALVCGQLAVGLSAIIGLTLIPGQCSPVILRYLKGGTLEIVGFGGTQIGSNFTPGWSLIPGGSLLPGSGFQIQAADPALSLNVASTIYFLASGATCVVGFIQHRVADYS